MAINPVNYRGFRVTRGDATGEQLALLVPTDYRVLHFASAADEATDWDVTNPTHPTFYVHSETTPATDYLAFDHDGTDGTINAVGGDLRLAQAGTDLVVLASTGINALDDVLLSVGTGSTARFSWDTTDANANEMLLQLPAGGATDVPVLIIGQAIESVDPALYNGVVDPRVAMFGTGAVATGPVLEFRKARGTFTSPTVVTTGDDMGTIDFYGAVAAGEYVRGASIRGDMAGTIATTRGPGTLTFLTATDAAPSVLTAALTLNADQTATFGGTISNTAGTGSLGITSTAPWQNLFLGNTAVIDFNNGDVVLTHAANRLTLTGGDFTIGSVGGLTGDLRFIGTTSGAVTLTVADAAGTWTMVLPTAVGAGGQQLTDAGGDGITSWAAASLGEWKNDLGVLDPETALQAMVSAPTHIFTYNKDVLPEGQWDGGGARMTGIFAEEAPWAMHGERDGYRSGIAFSAVNAFGYTRAAIQALNEKIEAVEAELARYRS